MKRITALSLTLLVIIIYTIYLKLDIFIGPVREFLIPILPKPTISILMSSYNMGDSIGRTIDSIINQTYKDWEFIIIDDGSIDRTQRVLKKYRRNWKIRIITNEKNIGLIPSLNNGLKKVRGKYIARMDADDFSYPDRFERTITLMERENLDFAGAWCSEGDYHYRTDTTDNLNTISIGLYLLIENNYCQSATMARKSFVDAHDIKYNPAFKNAEDYDYYMQILLKGGKFAYIGGNPLSKYHRSKHSQEWFAKQGDSARRIRENALSTIIPNYNEEFLRTPLTKLMPYIIEGNKTSKVFNQEELVKCNETQCYRWKQTLGQRL